MQSALGEGDREGNDFRANMEDRDKETEVLGGAPQTLKNGADFPLGPKTQVIASSHGNQAIPDCKVNGKPIVVGVYAYIKP
jgi:hypothetical protein